MRKILLILGFISFLLVGNEAFAVDYDIQNCLSIDTSGTFYVWKVENTENCSNLYSKNGQTVVGLTLGGTHVYAAGLNGADLYGFSSPVAKEDGIFTQNNGKVLCIYESIGTPVGVEGRLFVNYPFNLYNSISECPEIYNGDDGNLINHVLSESCTDGIQNQDETGIDYGGVCGGRVSSRTNANGVRVVCSEGETLFDYSAMTFSGLILSGLTQTYTETGSFYRQERYSSSDGNIYVDYNEVSIERSIFNSSVFTGGLTGGTGEMTIRALADYNTNIERKSPTITMLLRNNDYVRIRASGIGFDGVLYYSETNGTTSKKNAGKFIDNNGYVILYDVDGRTNVTKRLIINTNTNIASIFGIELGKYNGGYQSSNSCFTDDPRINQNYSVDCTVRRYNGGEVPVYETLSGTLLCGLESAQNVDQPPAACGWYAGYCMPTISIQASGSGYVAVDSSGGIAYTPLQGSGRIYEHTAESGALFDFDTYFNFKDFPASQTGNCSQMFNGSTFLYTSAGTNFSIKLVSGWALDNGNRWNCSFDLVNVNPCGVVYDIIGGIIGFGADSMNWLITKFMSNARNAMVFMGQPTLGETYCFLGDTIVLPKKPTSYFSYSEHATKDVSGNTALDFFVIALLVAAMIKIIKP